MYPLHKALPSHASNRPTAAEAGPKYSAPRALLCVAGILWLALSVSANANDGPLRTFITLNPEAALGVAQAALDACVNEGFAVAVALVDRSGTLQVMIRVPSAGPHTLDAALKKAWTAASFKADTAAIAEATRTGSGLSGARFVSGSLMIGGGVPLYAEGTIVGAVGVSGTPSPDDDQVCAQKGAEALEEILLF